MVFRITTFNPDIKDNDFTDFYKACLFAHELLSSGKHFITRTLEDWEVERYPPKPLTTDE